MGENDLGQRFIQSGYVITDPVKFAREIKVIPLKDLFDKLEEYSNKLLVGEYTYDKLENDVRKYLTDLSIIVSNSATNVSEDVSLAFRNLITRVANKYLINDVNNAEISNINNQISEKRKILDEVNRSLSTLINDNGTLNSQRIDLNNELNSLNNNHEMSVTNKTTRTFEIIASLDRINDQIEKNKVEIRKIRERSEEITRELKELQDSLENVKIADLPAVTTSLRDDLIKDINELNSFAIGRLNLSDEAKMFVKNLSSNFRSGLYTLFSDTKIASSKLEELYEKFGISKNPKIEITSKEEVKDENLLVTQHEKDVIRVPIIDASEKSEVKEEISAGVEEKTEITNQSVADVSEEEIPAVDDETLDKMIGIFTTKPQEKVAENDSVVIEEEKVKTENKSDDKPLLESKPKKVTYMGKYGNFAIFGGEYDKLEEGKEYTVTYEDDIYYRLEGFPSISFDKNAFASNEVWLAVSSLSSKNKEEKAAEDQQEVNEVVAEEEEVSKDEIVKKDLLYFEGNKIVFRPNANLTDEEKELFRLVFIRNGIEEGKTYTIKEVHGDGSITLEDPEVKVPTMGFVPESEFRMLPEKIQNLRVLSEEKEDNKIVFTYIGEDNGNLVKGHKYIIDYYFDSIANIIDYETNESFRIDNFDQNLFVQDKIELEKEEVVDEEEVEAEHIDHGYSEVIMVEEIQKLKKKGSRILTYSIVGLATSAMTLGLGSPVGIPVLIASALGATKGVYNHSFFAKDKVATGIFNRLKNEAKKYQKALESNNELDKEEFTDLKMKFDELESEMDLLDSKAKSMGLRIKK